MLWLKKIKEKWSSANYSPWRETALFLIAVLGFLVAYDSHRDSKKIASQQNQIEIDRKIREASGILKKAVTDVLEGRAADSVKLDEAEGSIHEILIRDPQNLSAHYLNVLLGLAHSDNSFAAKALEDLKQASPEMSAEMWHAVGLVAQFNGDIPEVERAFRQAVAADPNSSFDARNLAAVLRKQGKFAEALPFLEKLGKTYPKNCQITLELATTYLALAQPDDAYPHFLRTVQLCPTWQMAQMNAGHALARAGQFDSAARAYQAAIALEPNYAGAYSSLAAVYIVQSKYEMAKESLRDALTRDPNNAATYALLGDLRGKEGFKKESIQHYLRAIQLQSEYRQEAPQYIPALYANIAQRYLELRQFREAVFHSDRCLADNPGFADAIRTKIAALRGLKRFREADDLESSIVNLGQPSRPH